MLGLGKGLVVGMAVVLLAGGCGGDDDATPPTTRQVSTTVDPFAVPDPIDVAYVERVMAALDHLYGDAAREVARERALTDEFEAIMRSIYADKFVGLVLETWQKEEDRSFANLAATPGDPTTQITEAIALRPDCVVIAVDRDRSPVLAQAEPVGHQEYVVLERPADAVSSRRNPTGWVMALDGFDTSGPVTEEACDA